MQIHIDEDEKNEIVVCEDLKFFFLVKISVNRNYIVLCDTINIQHVIEWQHFDWTRKNPMEIILSFCFNEMRVYYSCFYSFIATIWILNVVELLRKLFQFCFLFVLIFIFLVWISVWNLKLSNKVKGRKEKKIYMYNVHTNQSREEIKRKRQKIEERRSEEKGRKQ